MNLSDFKISYDCYYSRIFNCGEFTTFVNETEQSFGVDDIKQIDVYCDDFSDITLTDGKIVDVRDIITEENEESIENIDGEILGVTHDHISLTDRESIEKYFNALAISLVLS